MKKITMLTFIITLFLGITFFRNTTAYADDTITPTPSMYITVTSPNNGEVWTNGETHRITWNSSADIDHVQIEEADSSGLLSGQITSGLIPNTGYYDWTIADNVSKDRQAKIIIYGVVNNYVKVQNVSNTFTILQQPSPTPIPMSLTVTSPNGGEVLQAGQNYRITWDNSNNIYSVEITAIGDNNSRTEVTRMIPNVGYYDWNVRSDFLNNVKYTPRE